MRQLSRKDCLSRGASLGLGLVGALTMHGVPTADAATVTPTRAAAALGPLPNIAQTWNNCGPASIAEVLAYWGIDRSQGAVAAALRVDGYQHGMGPYGVPSYARRLGMRALIGVAGSAALLKALVARGLPVIVTQWVSMTDQTSHYRPIVGYDDRQGIFVADDPYLGPNHAISYAEFAAMWAEDDNRFLVLYPPARQGALTAALASTSWNRLRAYHHDLAWVKARLASPAGEVASWAAPVAAPGARFLRLAWDEAQLGHGGAARQALQQASAEGAAATTVGWVAATLG